MVLAAGRGERMRPLTDRVPKPLLPVGGQPLVAWQLEILAAAGCRDIVMNCAWQAEALQDALGDGSRWGVRIRYSPEPWPALETGGGVFQALPLLGPEPFLLVNGDVYCEWSPAALALEPGQLAQLLLVPNPPHHPKGDFGLAGGRVRPDAAARYTYSGIAMLHPGLFTGCRPGRFPLAPLLVEAARQDKVGGLLHDGTWLDVGTPERLYALQARLGEA